MAPPHAQLYEFPIVMRAPQPDPSTVAYEPGTKSSPTPDEPPETLPNMDPAASQWQQLALMDRQSPDFLPLLSLLITGTNRSSTIALRGDDAKIALGALDEVSRPLAVVKEWPGGNLCTHAIHQLFRDDKIPNEHERDALSVMRSLAHDSNQVPPRYQVDSHTLTVEDDVIAGGSSSDVRKGRLGDMTVAVKTLRNSWKVDPHDAQKVRVVFICLSKVY